MLQFSLQWPLGSLVGRSALRDRLGARFAWVRVLLRVDKVAVSWLASWVRVLRRARCGHLRPLKINILVLVAHAAGGAGGAICALRGPFIVLAEHRSRLRACAFPILHFVLKVYNEINKT